MEQSGSVVSGSKVTYALRVASAMCFIGHGAFGIITKQIWLNYFAVFGIGPVMGYRIMPWLGTFDILLGLSLLLYPTRAVLTWLVVWGTITALLRPLSGEPAAEAIERAGNFGAPLALLMLLSTAHTIKGWFARLNSDIQIDPQILPRVITCLRIVVFMLLAGHGWLNLIEKSSLLAQYASLGSTNPSGVAHVAGRFEILAAFCVLIRPMRPMLIALLIWKMTTELFYPHWAVFEWIERGGSYGSILALWFLLPHYNDSKRLVKIRSLPSGGPGVIA